MKDLAVRSRSRLRTPLQPPTGADHGPLIHGFCRQARQMAVSASCPNGSVSGLAVGHPGADQASRSDGPVRQVDGLGCGVIKLGGRQVAMTRVRCRVLTDVRCGRARDGDQCLAGCSPAGRAIALSAQHAAYQLSAVGQPRTRTSYEFAAAKLRRARARATLASAAQPVMAHAGEKTCRRLPSGAAALGL